MTKHFAGTAAQTLLIAANASYSAVGSLDNGFNRTGNSLGLLLFPRLFVLPIRCQSLKVLPLILEKPPESSCLCNTLVNDWAVLTKRRFLTKTTDV